MTLTKAQKQHLLAEDITQRLGPEFEVTVEDSQVWASFSAKQGGRHSAVRVLLDRLDWRKRVAEDLPEVTAETIRQRFAFGATDPRYTEDAKALSQLAYDTALMRKDTITEDDFESKYRPRDAPSGGNTWSHAEVRDQSLEHVWTVVDGDDGDLYALAGFHVVNAVSYVVTEVPWPHECSDAVWAHFEIDEDEEERGDE